MRPRLSLQRVAQITDSHCGPACIQMMLAHLGVTVTQEAVVEAGGAGSRIELHGMRINQLARAVSVLAPSARFWCKDHAELPELIRLLHLSGTPIGVEWQGIFSDDHELNDPDFGHYSLVTHADDDEQLLTIADPYREYAHVDRVFPYATFVRRWWDNNEVEDEATGKTHLEVDHQMMFLVTLIEATFPLDFGMRAP